ncbi:hypothetical protein [Bifidobacterium aquikefiri]
MGMRRASEHREDRYSSSLHVVTQEDATRVGDTKSHVAGMQRVKGSFMDSEQTQRIAAHKQEHIERIRQMRRAAIRRRQFIVAALAIVTVVLIVLGATTTISMLYALIPAILLLGVLMLGARAAKSARAWERRIARGSKGAANRVATIKAADARSQADTPEHRQALQPAGEKPEKTAVQPSNRRLYRDGHTPSFHQRMQTSPATATDVLNKAEIQRILQLAKQEQQRSEKSSSASRSVSVESSASARSQTSAHTTVSKPDSHNVAGASEPQRQAAARKASLPNVDMPKLEQDSQQKAASQDLISFSLGSARDAHDLQSSGPESREIKSSKQVSIASPTPKRSGQLTDKSQGEQHTASKSTLTSPRVGAAQGPAASTVAEQPVKSVRKESDSSQSRQAADETREISVAGVVGKAELESALADSPTAAADAESELDRHSDGDSEQFHANELHAEVDPPTQSSESLSIGLETILSRRGNN